MLRIKGGLSSTIFRSVVVCLSMSYSGLLCRFGDFSLCLSHCSHESNQRISNSLLHRISSRSITAPQLIPVIVTAEQDAVAEQPLAVTQKIEIDVAGKYCVRVGSGFDGQALRRVLDVLEQR